MSQIDSLKEYSRGTIIYISPTICGSFISDVGEEFKRFMVANHYKNHLVLILEYPLNSRPSEFEKDCSLEFMCRPNANFVVAIRLNEAIHDNFFYSIDEINSNTERKLYQCSLCEKVLHQRHSIVIDRSRYCLEHFVNVTSSYQPDLNIKDDHVQTEINKYLRSATYSVDAIDLRTALFRKQYDRMKNIRSGLNKYFLYDDVILVSNRRPVNIIELQKQIKSLELNDSDFYREGVPTASAVESGSGIIASVTSGIRSMFGLDSAVNAPTMQTNNPNSRTILVTPTSGKYNNSFNDSSGKESNAMYQPMDNVTQNIGKTMVAEIDKRQNIINDVKYRLRSHLNSLIPLNFIEEKIAFLYDTYGDQVTFRLEFVYEYINTEYKLQSMQANQTTQVRTSAKSESLSSAKTNVNRDVLPFDADVFAELQNNITVQVEFPEYDIYPKTVTLKKGFNSIQIRNTLTQKMNSIDRDDIVIFVMKNGWGREVKCDDEYYKNLYYAIDSNRNLRQYDLQDSSKTYDLSFDNNSILDVTDSYATIHSIQNNDLLTVRRMISANVGEKLSLSSLAAINRFNQAIQDKIRILSQTFIGYRKIRGDGNCYYRSVIFGLVELLLHQGRLQDLIKLLAKADNHSDGNLLAFLIQLAKGDESVENKVKLFERNVLDSRSGFDLMLILTCRKLIANWINEHAEDDFNGMTLRETLMSIYECRNIDEYNEKYVLTMGEDAEGPFVELGLLPRCLNCNCQIVYLDRSSANDMMSFTNTPADSKLYANTIFILLRPGHYDLLYLHPELQKLHDCQDVIDVPSRDVDGQMDVDKADDEAMTSESQNTGFQDIAHCPNADSSHAVNRLNELKQDLYSRYCGFIEEEHLYETVVDMKCTSESEIISQILQSYPDYYKVDDIEYIWNIYYDSQEAGTVNDSPISSRHVSSRLLPRAHTDPGYSRQYITHDNDNANTLPRTLTSQARISQPRREETQSHDQSYQPRFTSSDYDNLSSQAKVEETRSNNQSHQTRLTSSDYDNLNSQASANTKSLQQKGSSDSKDLYKSQSNEMDFCRKPENDSFERTDLRANPIMENKTSTMSFTSEGKPTQRNREAYNCEIKNTSTANTLSYLKVETPEAPFSGSSIYKNNGQDDVRNDLASRDRVILKEAVSELLRADSETDDIDKLKSILRSLRQAVPNTDNEIRNVIRRYQKKCRSSKSNK